MIHRLLLFCGLCFAALVSSAQTSVALPVDSTTGLVTYGGIVERDGQSSQALYQKSMAWIKGHYKNPASFFQLKDPEKGKIEGKHRFNLYQEVKGTSIKSGEIRYSLTLWFKEGKYRYRITKFNLEKTSYFPIERWLEPNMQKQDQIRDNCRQIDEFCTGLIEEYITFMATAVEVIDEDEW